eukprot:4034698-Alexandrium_andersonii.AAC.1
MSSTAPALSTVSYKPFIATGMVRSSNALRNTSAMALDRVSSLAVEIRGNKRMAPPSSLLNLSACPE